jgi:hypothetical protein
VAQPQTQLAVRTIWGDEQHVASFLGWQPWQQDDRDLISGFDNFMAAG